MRTKEDMLKDLGVNAEYSAHGGIPADTKEVILIEVFIDLRDAIVNIFGILSAYYEDGITPK